MRDGCGDEELLEALREAMRARQAVPPGFAETGKSAYAWHNIDAELAQLTYDSSRDKDRSTSVRAETAYGTASIRTLTFASAQLSIDLEVSDDLLLGLVVPAREGTIEVRTLKGVTTAAPVDEIGRFSIEPIPPSPFRLRCRTARGGDVLTGWIAL